MLKPETIAANRLRMKYHQPEPITERLRAISGTPDISDTADERDQYTLFPLTVDGCNCADCERKQACRG
jgi:hypothetical protein